MNELSIQSESELLAALRNTVYPEASDEALKLVIAFCKGMQLDPLTKPVHIGKFKGRDTLIPGIGYYRIRAHRTNQYLGMSDPVYGNDITEKLGENAITYPSKCSIVVKRLVGERIAEFAGHAIWKEAYGTIADGVTPNSFWRDRPYSQLAKVAESDALRKAFPDLVTHQPTFEETHGQLHDVDGERLSDAQLAVKNASNKLKHDLLKAEVVASDSNLNPMLIGDRTGNWVIDDLIKDVLELIKQTHTPDHEIKAWLTKAGVAKLENLTEDQLIKVIEKLKRDLKNGD